MKKLHALAAAAAAALVLAGCSANSPEPAPAASAQDATSSLLARHGLAGLDAEAVIQKLDATPVAQRDAGLMASIRADELQLADEQGQGSLPMPRDKFYVSFAPYISQTHECYYHSLTTCRGELSKTPMTVKIVDDQGTTIVDEQATTLDNGFYGVWLPRDMSGTLQVEARGKSLNMPISTGAQDPTCLTTTQLA